MTNRQIIKRNSGAALLTALGLLVIFAMLGTAYLKYMTIEEQRVSMELRNLSSRYAAKGGVEAAIASIQSALLSGDAVPGELEDLVLGVYMKNTQEPGEILERENRSASAKVTIMDECARLNINHADASVLREAMGLSGANARAIAQSVMPQSGGPQWFASVDELSSRGLFGDDTDEVFAGIDRNLLTVYTAADPSYPTSYINVNSAEPEVLAAVLDVPLETAEAISKEDGFSSVAQLEVAAGKSADSFRLPATALCFKSRCFRIVSEGSFSSIDVLGNPYRTSNSRVEAVVLFDGMGNYKVRFWSEAGQIEDAAEEAEVVEVEDADVDADADEGEEEELLEEDGSEEEEPSEEA